MTVQEKRRQLFETMYPLPSGLAFGATGSYVVTSVPALKFAELSRFEYNKLWGCFNETLDAIPTVVTAHGVKMFPERFPEGSTPEPGWDAGYESGYNDGVDGLTKSGLWEVYK